MVDRVAESFKIITEPLKVEIGMGPCEMREDRSGIEVRGGGSNSGGEIGEHGRRIPKRETTDPSVEGGVRQHPLGIPFRPIARRIPAGFVCGFGLTEEHR